MSDACDIIVEVSDDAADDVSSSGSNSDEPIRKKQTANILSFLRMIRNCRNIWKETRGIKASKEAH